MKTRKCFALLLALCLLVGCLPLSASAATPTSGKCGENVIWNFDRSTGILTISGKGPMEDFAYDIPGSGIRLPPWNDGQYETDIAFGNEIKTIRINEGVTSIGESAFRGCEALTSVSYPNSVTSIGDGAFSYCSNLSEINISKNISFFSGFDCQADDGANPFAGSNNLKRITVDSANKAFSSVDGVLYNKSKTTLVVYPGGKGNSYSIPNGTKTIGGYAFNGCSNLSSITIPNSVIRIRPYAFANSGITSITIPSSITRLDDPWIFEGSKSLRSIKLPKTVVSLGESVPGSDYYWESGLLALPDPLLRMIREPDGIHCYNYGLQEILVDPENPVYASIDGVLYNKAKTKLLYFPDVQKTEYTIPNGVTSIDSQVFQGCLNLRSLTIPKSITSISSSAFSSANQYADLTIYGIKGSYAESFAHSHNIKFTVVDSTDKPTEPLPTQFRDVKSSDYFCEAVKWAVKRGITSGTSDMQFSPDAPCTRGQAVTFLWRAAGKPEPANSGTGFSDVKSGAYYEKAVQWAVENGITSGTGNEKFSPEATCTRAQIVTFMYRAENSPAVSEENSFSDVASTAYYKDAVQWAAKNGITSGTGNGKFSPESKCVRGQIVTFLYRYSGE